MSRNPGGNDKVTNVPGAAAFVAYDPDTPPLLMELLHLLVPRRRQREHGGPLLALHLHEQLEAARVVHARDRARVRGSA